MDLPKPPSSLGGACTILFNDKLYSFSGDAFQFLPLQNSAEWSQLPMGVPVTGGVCVKATPGNDTAALYVVGGTSNSSDFQGLQRFTFDDEKWETLTPTVPVTQNRLYHGAVYLNASSSILVYAGSQDGSQALSSQTFTIMANEPYAVLAYQSIAPPAISPLLLQWSETDAIYIGGSETNTKVMQFNPASSWADSGINLAEPLHNKTAEKSALLQGDDGSKHLYTFDMSVSPNAVNRTVLVDGNQQPVPLATPVVSRRSLEAAGTTRLMTRENNNNLTVGDWPPYNNTFAPTSTRDNYAIAQGPNGLVVISGGNEEDPLCIFDTRGNCWDDAKATLAQTSNQPNTGSPSPSSSSSSDPGLSGSSGPPGTTKRILASILGTLGGLALLSLGIWLFLRWRRKRLRYLEAGHLRRSSGLPDEKDAFADMLNAPIRPDTTRHFQGHVPQPSNGSFSSVALLMGRKGHKRGDKGGSHGSDSSSQFSKKYRAAISKPIPQEQPPYQFVPDKNRSAKAIAFEKTPVVPRPRANKNERRGSTRRSSGWNRYWSGGSAMNTLGLTSKRTTMEDLDAGSHYSDQRGLSQIAQDSSKAQNLQVNNGRPGLNTVASGSPTLAHMPKGMPISQEMSGEIRRPESECSASTYNDDRHDAFSSGVPASVHEQKSWLPVDRQDWETLRNLYKSQPQGPSRYQQMPGPSKHNNRYSPQPFSSDMSWLNLGGDSRP